jgi:hypothetical protein
MMWTRAALGLPMGAAPLDGIRLQFMAWVISLLVAIPVCLYGCAMLMAGLLSSVLVISGRMTTAEALAYSLKSEYPASWFAPGK